LGWPLKAPPSPIVGTALDGRPIYGPYDHTGRLAGGLDICGGKLGPDGEYRYYLQVTPPFLPQCLRGPVGELQELGGRQACPQPTEHTRVVQDGPWMFGLGCPDHPFFHGVVRAAVGNLRRLEDACAAPCDAWADPCGGDPCGGDPCGGDPCSANPCGGTCPATERLPVNPCSAGFALDSPQAAAPESYFVRHPFTAGAVLVVPPYLYQARDLEGDCPGSFAETKDTQQHNADHPPPLNGPRERILRCRRSSGGEAAPAHLGFRPYRHSSGDDVYGVFMDNSVIDPLEDWDWIDDLTSRVRADMFFYTPALSMATLVLVEFSFLNTGRVMANFELSSIVLPMAGTLEYNKILVFSILALCLTLVYIYSFVGRRPAAAVLKKNRADLVFGVSILLGQVWSLLQFLLQGNDVVDKFDNLIRAFMSGTRFGTGAQIRENLVYVTATFFDVQELVLSKFSLEATRQFGVCMMVIALIARLSLFFDVHPRTGVVIRTLRTAGDDLWHLSVVFIPIILGLAWLSAFALGGSHEDFATPGYALVTGYRIVLGDFIFKGPDQEKWETFLFFVVFALAVNIALLNFLIAIVVDALLRAKKENEDNITEESFFRDCYLTYLYVGLAKHHGWPCADSLSKRLNTFPHDMVEVPFTAWEFVAASRRNSCHAGSRVAAAVDSKVSDPIDIHDEAMKEIHRPAVEAFFSFFEHHFEGRFRFSVKSVTPNSPTVVTLEKKTTMRSELAVQARSSRVRQLHNRVAKLQALYRRGKARKAMQTRYSAVLLVQRCARRWLKWKRGRMAEPNANRSIAVPKHTSPPVSEAEVLLQRINDMVDCLLSGPAGHDEAATEVLLVH